MAKPNYIDYGLTEIKVRSLENPARYSAERAYNDANRHRLHKISNPDFKVYLLYALVWIFLCFLCTRWIGDDWRNVVWLISVVFVVPFACIIFTIIQDYLENKVANSPCQTRFGLYVPVTEEDKENYALYKIDLDEYENKDVYISWYAIRFYEGVVELNRRDVNRKYTFQCSWDSKYTPYIEVLKEQLPKVYIRYKNRIAYLSNPNIFEDVIEIIVTYIESKKQEEKDRLDAIIKANPYLRESIEKRNIIKNEIKNSRSEYLKYLYEHQSLDKVIVKTYERPIYANQSNLPYERAYIFTIEKRKGEYCIIFENTNDYARATVVLEADDETYAECLKAIYDFMRCPKTLNKREKLRQEKKVDEFVSHSVNHKDFISWQHQILGYKKSRTKIRKLRRKYRRWY